MKPCGLLNTGVMPDKLASETEANHTQCHISKFNVESQSGFNHSNNNYTLIALFIFWIGLTYWRTKYLGFYSDDWIFLSNTSISPGTLVSYLVANNYARPVYSVIAWAGNMLAQGSPVYWQAISSVTILIASVAVFKVLQHIYSRAGYAEKSSLLGALIGSLFLLLSPFDLAVFVWSTGVLTLWSLIFFCFGYLKIQSASRSGKYIGFFLILAGFLVYEAYWFTFIPLLVIACDFKKNNTQKIVRQIMWFAIPLVVALLYQRVALPYFIGGHPKPIRLENLLLIAHNILVLQGHMVIWLACAALALKSGMINVRRLSGVGGAVLLGVTLSGVVYAIAGYKVSGNGVMSRTMAAQSLYFAAGFGILAASAAEKFTSKIKLTVWNFVFLASTSVMFTYMLCSFVTRMADWVRIQEQSVKVLRSISPPLNEYINKLGDHENLIVVVQVEGDPHGQIFGASWEMSGGAAWIDPRFSDIKFLTAREGDWQTAWDGEKISQSWCKLPNAPSIETLSTRREPLYLKVNPVSGQIFEVTALTKFIKMGCLESTALTNHDELMVRGFLEIVDMWK